MDLGSDPIVLGIPRGGVPVAAAVARRLRLPLDVLVAHKIGSPFQPELAIGAIAADGTRVVEPFASEVLRSDVFERAAEAELHRARRRESELRAGRPPVGLADRTVIMVDDGIAVGSTLAAAVGTTRAAGAARVIVAVPVASVAGAARIRRLADELVVLATPSCFMGVGEWYVDFGQVSDETVRDLLTTHEAPPAGHRGF